jgi:hypothetical protein
LDARGQDGSGTPSRSTNNIRRSCGSFYFRVSDRILALRFLVYRQGIYQAVYIQRVRVYRKYRKDAHRSAPLTSLDPCPFSPSVRSMLVGRPRSIGSASRSLLATKSQSLTPPQDPPLPVCLPWTPCTPLGPPWSFSWYGFPALHLAFPPSPQE